MQLSDTDIRGGLEDGSLVVSPLADNNIQPASVDVHLGNDFIFYKPYLGFIETKQKQNDYTYEKSISNSDYIVIPPQGFMLACTKETIGVNDQHSAQITGKSSLARMGLIVHTTAGFIDPGNCLVPTLELYNTNSVALKLYPGQPIAQILFYRLSSPCTRSYGDAGLNSKYKGDTSVTASKNYKNF